VGERASLLQAGHGVDEAAGTKELRGMTKIYVGNLPFTTGDDELRELFARFGTPSSARVVTDKMTGRSRGFGFVEFDDDEQAKAAIAELNGRDFNGRALTVNEARPQTGDRGPRGGGGGGRGRGGERGGYGGGRGGYGGGGRDY
jgi:RNA recognition motif-containing protein